MTSKARYALGMCIAAFGFLVAILAGLEPILSSLVVSSLTLLVLAWFSQGRAAAAVPVILGFLILVLIPVTRLPPSLDHVQVAAPAVFVAAITICLVRTKNLNSLLVPASLILVFIGISAISTINTPDENEWQVFILNSSVALGGVVLGWQIFVNAMWDTFSKLVILIAIMQSVYSVVEVVWSIQPLWRGANIRPSGESIAGWSQIFEGFVRAQGTLGHPLPLALLMLVGIALVLNTSLRVVWKVIAVFTLYAGLIATGSRNALILAILLLVLHMYKARMLRTLLVAGVSAITIPLILVPLWMPSLEKFLESGSVTHRLSAFAAIGNLMQRDAFGLLFGDGAASAPRLYSEGLLQSDGLEAVDNQVVLTLAETGIIGAIFLALVVFGATRHSKGVVRILLLVFIVEFFIFDVLVWPASAIFVWIAIGFSYSSALSLERQRVSPMNVSRAAMRERRSTIWRMSVG